MKEIKEELVTNSERVRSFLNTYSLARTVLTVDELRMGAMARYEVEGDTRLSDIHCLKQNYNSNQENRTYGVVSAEDMSCDKQKSGDRFYPLTFEHHINTNDEGYLIPNYNSEDNFLSDKMTDEIFDKIKIQFLNRQEKLFLNFLKEVEQKLDRYVYCETVDQAVEEIKKRDYKKLWVGKDFAEENIIKELPNQQSNNSSNLKGFILAHKDDPKDIGYFTIRCDICILPDIKGSQFVTFEDIAMSVVGQNLTYIEVKNDT